MAFVKLDCRILDSSLWLDRPAREMFITALLMAEPWEVVVSTPQIRVRSLKNTEWSVPPGWYGLARAAGSAIIRRCGIDLLHGLAALERLGAPEVETKSSDFGGRRLVRVDGGYLVLNFMKYRERDETVSERVRRHRTKMKGVGGVTPLQPLHPVTPSAPPSAVVAVGVGGAGEGEPVRRVAAHAFKAINGWRKDMNALAEHFVSLEAVGAPPDFVHAEIPRIIGESPWTCCDRVRDAWKILRDRPAPPPEEPQREDSTPERKAEIERILAEGRKRYGVAT